MKEAGMLVVLMLVALLMLLPDTGAQQQPFCTTKLVRTGKVIAKRIRYSGQALSFNDSPMIITHPCRRSIALYLGPQVFLTKDNFESSLPPLTVPDHFLVFLSEILSGLFPYLNFTITGGTKAVDIQLILFQLSHPTVTSALFSEKLLIFVINQNVYLLNYEDDLWDIAIGVEKPVSHIAVDNCCYSKHLYCTIVSTMVFAYLFSDDVRQTTIYFSDSQGYFFSEYSLPSLKTLNGSLGGVFFFPSLSQSAILLVNNKKASFNYVRHPLNRSPSIIFDYNETLSIIVNPGLKGILILWSQRSLLVSRNTGQLVDSIYMDDRQHVYRSISEANITIYSVVSNANEMMIVTMAGDVYYGNLGYLALPAVKLGSLGVWNQQLAAMFVDIGRVEVIWPVPDSRFVPFDFQKCTINIQAHITDPHLKMDACMVELLQGDFDNQMYTIDMNQVLELHALLIPRPGSSLIPLAMVSNPHSLGLETIMNEVGYNYDGNMKYSLDITLKQQHHWGRADPNFTSEIEKPSLSTVTVDVANKELTCIDLKPLTALISLGCDMTKRIAIRKGVTACDKGILSPKALRYNYSYVLEKESYDPNFLNQETTKDKTLQYNYQLLGCPILVYYDNPWKPVVELWQNNKFVEEMTAEYVVLEMNGLFTYTYSLTAGTAKCSSQPQNWTKIISLMGPYTWTRNTYISCHNPKNKEPLKWPNVRYQVLGGKTDNKLVFSKRNGIYIFYLTIVDPQYSFCHLQTIFSVFVYGALPETVVKPEVGIFIVFTILFCVWISYFIPKILHPERGAPIRYYFVQRWRQCKRILQYFFRWPCK